MELRAPGYVPSQQEVQVPARATRELTFELEELAEEYEGISPGYFWAAVGLSAAAFAAGGVLGIRTLRDRRSVDDCLAANPGPQGLACNADERRQEIGDSGRNADILVGVGGLFAAGAVVFAVFTNWDGDDPDPDADPEAGDARAPPCRLAHGRRTRPRGALLMLRSNSLAGVLLALPLMGACTFLNLDGFDVPSCLDFGDTPREQALACATALGGADGVPAGCVPLRMLAGHGPMRVSSAPRRPRSAMVSTTTATRRSTKRESTARAS